MKCSKCGCWVAPEWLLRWVEYGALLLAVVVAAFIFSGCSQISYTTPECTRITYTRIGNQDISGLRIEKDALGMYRITLDKQSSDSDVLNLIRQLVAQ